MEPDASVPAVPPVEQPPTAPAQKSWIHRRWVPWVAGALAFALTLLAGGVVIVDSLWRSVEMRELIERVEASEAVMVALQDSAEIVFEQHGAGSDPDKLDSELRDLSATAGPDIAAAGERVAALPIAVWHTDIERARDAYLAHNRAWQEYMERASKSAAEFVAPQPLVNQTFFDAEAPFFRAVPVPDIFDLRERVALIFADNVDGGGSSGEQILSTVSAG